MSKSQNPNKTNANLQKKEKYSSTIVLKPNRAVSIFKLILLIGLVILLFCAPYFRGLYFKEEMGNVHIYSGILFLIYVVYKLLNRDYKVFKTPLDIAAGILVLAYFIPILFGFTASLSYGYDIFLRYVNYFLIYLIARDLISGYKNIEVLLNALIVGGLGISVLGIDAGAGMIIVNKINGFLEWLPKFLGIPTVWAKEFTIKFFGLFVEGRIHSTLQYPNVLASYLGAIFILIIGLQTGADKWWKRFWYGAAGFVIFYTFVLTQSRGMYLLLPLMILLLLIVLQRKELIINAVVYSGVLGLLGIIFSIFYSKFVQTGQYAMVWVSVLGGIIFSGILSILFGTIMEFLHRIKTRFYLVGLGVLIVLGVGFIVTALNIEEPLIIKHDVKEPASEKYVLRDIAGVKPNTKYLLQFDINATSTVPNKTAYKIVVFSINPFAELEHLAEISGGPEKATKKLEFTTKPDTKNLRINMYNIDSGTSAGFSKFVLKDLSTGSEKRIIVQYKYLPTDLVYRIKSINLKEHNAWQRFIFMKDAFKIIRDYPVFGTGGGGWRALYHKYQSYYYTSNEVHSYPVQVWVETGIVGFLALLGIGLLIVHHFYKTRREFIEEDMGTLRKIILTSTVFTAIISLYGHSIIDFDLSLSAVSIMLWVLMGFVSGFYIETSKYINVVRLTANVILSGIMVMLALVILVVGSNSLYARTILNEMEKYSLKDTASDKIIDYLKKRVSIYEKYLSLQPLDEARRLEYIRYVSILIQQLDFNRRNNAGNKSAVEDEIGEYVMKLKNVIEEGMRNEPYSFSLLSQAAAFYIGVRDFEKGLQCADKAVESARFIGEVYKNKAECYLTAGQYVIEDGKSLKDNGLIEKGKSYLLKAKDIKKEIQEANAKALKPMNVPSSDIDQIVKQAEEALKNL